MLCSQGYQKVSRSSTNLLPIRFARLLSLGLINNDSWINFVKVSKYFKFNREQARAKKCLKQLVDSDCTFSSLEQEVLDLAYSDYNPFCSNLRDPGATGKGQCEGVRDLNAAAGLKPSVMQALLFSLVSLSFFQLLKIWNKYHGYFCPYLCGSVYSFYQLACFL